MASKSRGEEKLIPIKCVVIGESYVGKTSILTYLTQRKFLSLPEPTVGAAFSTYNLDKQVEEKWSANKTPLTLKLRFELWDTAGQERYRSIVPMYLRGASVIFIVYDRTSKESYENATNYWYKFIDSNLDKTTVQALATASFKRQIYLIENKTDMDNVYNLDYKARKFCQENQLEFWQTSAKVGSGIRELFNEIANKIIIYSQKYDIKNIENLMSSDYYLPVKIKEQTPELLEYESNSDKKKKCFPCQ